MRLVGEMAIWLALLMAAWAFTVYFIGASRLRQDLITSGDRAVHAVLGLTGTGAVALLAALTGRDFTARYVAVYTNVNLPQPYSVSAFWSGAHGSLLFLILALSILTAAILFTRGGTRRFEVQLLAMVLIVLLATLCIAFNPFSRLDWVPIDGIGMHPQLQSPGAAVFPPLLFVAYACYAVPAVMAASAALRGRADSDSIDAVQRWTAVGWLFNTLGMLAGLWWAYREPSRNAEWPLFPLESGAIFPWLASSAFLVAALVQRRRGKLAAWSVTLVIASFFLAVPAAVLGVPANLLRPGEVAGSPFFVVLCIAAVIAIAVASVFVGSRLHHIDTTPRPVRVHALAIAGVSAVMILAAFAGRTARTERTVLVGAAQPVVVDDGAGARWTIGSQGLSSYNVLNRQVTALALDVHRNGKRLGLVSPEIRQYVDIQGAPLFQPSSEPGISSSVGGDIYVVLGEVTADDVAALTVIFNPFMVWLWVGGVVLAMSGIAVAWPSRFTNGALA